MRGFVIAVILFAVPASVLSRPLRVREHASTGNWQVQVERSTFTGEVLCRLSARGRKVIYLPDALGFRFNRRLDTTDATFRVDGGAAYRWRDQLPELAHLEVPIDGKRMDAPTDGIVWLPSAMLEKASQVAIQPHPDRRPRIFLLDRFFDARLDARTRGCSPEGRFVR